ncbi:hypothetical protein EVAR_30080_1 [Eumeta japonica]|uniref:Uncharacterized protein n=1 Tax=Eumeta variegata TaxID=151549 RepID=A0A4C1X7Q0_EUMVA|nr:hypothetical protein EVAR_30080_1 [Eumeta japonica]
MWLSPCAGHSGRVLCMCVTRESQYLVTGSEDTSVIVWDLHTLAIKIKILYGADDIKFGIGIQPPLTFDVCLRSEHIAPVLCVAAVVSRSLVISGGEDSAVILTSLLDGAPKLSKIASYYVEYKFPGIQRPRAARVECARAASGVVVSFRLGASVSLHFKITFLISCKCQQLRRRPPRPAPARPPRRKYNDSTFTTAVLHSLETQYTRIYRVIGGARSRLGAPHPPGAPRPAPRARDSPFRYKELAISPKALDCVNHETLIRKLHHYGVTSRALDLLASYLTNTVKVDDNDMRPSGYVVRMGVPQGSIIVLHSLMPVETEIGIGKRNTYTEHWPWRTAYVTK